MENSFILNCISIICNTKFLGRIAVKKLLLSFVNTSSDLRFDSLQSACC